MEQPLSPLKDRLFVSFLLLLIWIPLPLGSNRVFAWSLMEMAIFIIAIIWLWQYRQGKRVLPTAFRKAWPALVILGIWLAYIGFQILPLPPQWIAAISPQSAAMHALVEEASGEPFKRWITISVAPDITAQAFVKSVAYVLFFALTLLFVRSRVELKWLGYAIVASGLIQALYGIFMVLSGLELGFFMEKSGFRDVVTGTFINRNSLANFLTLCMTVGIGLLLSQLNNGGGGSWRVIFRSTLSWLLSGKMRLRFVLIIMAVALVMTHSRMGNAAFFLSLLIAGVASIILSKRSPRSAVILLTSLVVLDLLVIGSMVGMDKVVERMEQTSAESVNRDEVALDMLNYWDDYRWSGSGLGSYYTTYPSYRSEVVSDSFYNHAHNDYLEMFAEVGIIGVTLLGLFVLATLWAVFRVLWRRHDPWCRGFAFSALMSICAILIHATVDFNLQIPANSAFFMVITALGWLSFGLPSKNKAYLPSQHWNGGYDTSDKKGFVVVSIFILSLILAKTAMWAGSDLITNGSNYQMSVWNKNSKVEPLTLQKQLEKQETASRLSPDNFYSLYTMGRVAFWQTKLNTNAVVDSKEYKQMHQQFRLATESAPVNPMGWLLRAVSLYYQQDFGGEFQKSLQNAQQLGRWENAVQKGVILMGENSWDNLSANSQQIVINAMRDSLIKHPSQAKKSLIKSPLWPFFCQADKSDMQRISCN
ncbi:MAG: hypothetical protein DRQ62_12155 [Gammaproteobacteria bacterium]|nr:MAG: hypothetical protein DRQ62_12155 [Gammaproteobacteria bacterium]